MSVFQLRDWWGLQLSNSSSDSANEEFDLGAMAIGNVDNCEPPADKIVVGSQSGTMRIFYPTRENYRVEDLMVEENFGVPILQVLLGMFLPGSNLLGIAILFPRRLSVFEVIPQGGRDGRISYYALQKHYSHDLGINGGHFTAFNMISGSFGGVRGREMILVQSLDGKLQIFEQSANAFTRQIADCLVPGPIWYMPKLDGFITATYSTYMECYKYQVLAASQSESESKSDNQYRNTTGMFNLTAIRGAMVEWSTLLGDQCRQIIDGHFSGLDSSKSSVSNNELLVLCEQSLFLLKESGGILQQRKLDFEPSCMCAYRLNDNTRGHNVLLAGQDGTLRVFSNFNLSWAAKLDRVPVQLAVGNFGGNSGMIVTLDDSGYLNVGFLGTKPPTQMISLASLNKVDYDKMDEEHRQLLQVIRDSQSEGKSNTKEKSLSIRVQMSRNLNMESIHGIDIPVGDRVVLPDDIAVTRRIDDAVNQDTRNLIKISARVFLSFAGDQAITNVTLTPNAPDGIFVYPRSVSIPRIAGAQATPFMEKFYIFSRTSGLPLTPEVVITASYSSPQGEPRVTSTVLPLPFHMLCQPRPPLKSALYKATLNTTFSAQALTDLFSEYLAAINEAGIMDLRESLGAVAAQALAFSFYGSHATDISKVLQIKAEYNATGGNSATANSNQAAAAAGGGNGSQMKLMASLNDVIGLHNSPALVSIVVSKNAGRYRISSDSLPALAIVALELENRLNRVMKDGGGNTTPSSSNNVTNHDPSSDSVASVVTCDDSPPLEELYAAIDVHHTLRLRLQELLSSLNDTSHQFRVLQKRLLVRFKDRNPTPLGGLDLIMRETYDKLMKIGDEVEQVQEKLSRSLSDILGIAKFAVALTGMRYNLSFAERRVLENSFCPNLTEGLEQGWEETVDASMMYLLKTSLAKNVKDSATLAIANLELSQTVDGLKKHITMVFDRISKGAHLIVAPSSTTLNSSKKNEKP